MKKIISPLREQRPIQKTEDKHLEGIEAHLDISINKARIWHELAHEPCTGHSTLTSFVALEDPLRAGYICVERMTDN